MTHVKSLGMGIRQVLPWTGPSIPERVERWSQLANKYGKLAAVPSKYLRGELPLDKVDRIESEFKKSMAERLVPFLKPGMRICDVGCGPASFAQHLIPLMRKHGGGTYFGVDLSPEILRQAEQTLTTLNLLGPDVRFVNRLAHQIAQLGEFDLIINGQNFIHIVDEIELEKTIENQCAALSRHDGKIFVYNPFTDDNPALYPTPPGQKGFRKNEFTLIRSEGELNRLFAGHHIVPTAQRYLSEYFDEIYTDIVYHKVDECIMDRTV